MYQFSLINHNRVFTKDCELSACMILVIMLQNENVSFGF